MRTKGALINT